MRKNNHILLAVASLLLAGTTVSCNEDTYTGGVSGTNVVSVATYNSFTLPTDQSDGTADANYMTASVEAQERTALSLAFAHKTA